MIEAFFLTIFLIILSSALGFLFKNLKFRDLFSLKYQTPKYKNLNGVIHFEKKRSR